MNKEEYDKLSTYEKIKFDIDMKMYMKHNSKIASINEHLGDIYSYKDLEEAKAYEEYDTLQEYKKALRKKCEVLDKIKEYLNKVELGELANGKPYKFIDFLKEEIDSENEEAKWLLELLEEIE